MREMSMKKVAVVLSVMALLALAAVLIGAANGANGSQHLVVDVKWVSFSPANSANSPKGAAYYAELDVFREGEIGGVPIGEGHQMTMATQPIGTSGALGLWVFRIFGEGELHATISPRDPNLPCSSQNCIGVITGGTGIYLGASGDFSRENLNGGENRVTFNFN